MFKNKKVWYYIGGGVAVLGILAYLEYKRLMNFELSFNSFKVNKINKDEIDANLYFNFLNKSSLPVDVLSQKYDIYINDIYITTATNQINNKVRPKATSVVGVNIKLTDWTKLIGSEKNLVSILSSLSSLNMKVVEKVKVKVLGIPYTIDYTYVKPLTGAK
jgi:LEA14-like dessication related protein